MGGGVISKMKMIREDGEPVTFLQLNEPYDWICGGTIPCFRETLNFLKGKQVKLIVSLTLDPLKAGLNINHVPFDHDQTEWTFGDDIRADLEYFEHLHVPTADAGPLFDGPRLVEFLQDFRQRNPDAKVYFHCWLGKGRTTTAIFYVLMKMYNKTCEEVEKILGYEICSRLKPSQIKFLENSFDSLCQQDIETFKPEVRTPFDHPVYKEIDPYPKNK